MNTKINNSSDTVNKEQTLSNHDLKLIALDKACAMFSIYLEKNTDAIHDKNLDILSNLYSKVYKLYQREFNDRIPAVPIAESIEDDRIVCLIDGARVKMLKKYLQNKHGMSEEEYRRMWNLPPEYPMVARKYSEQRRALAKKSGLGLNSTKRAHKVAL